MHQTVADENADIVAPCQKILNYDFNGNYDSDSCYNFASGVSYNEPSLTGDMLCLNGQDQFVFVSVPFYTHVGVFALHVYCHEDALKM